MIGTNIDSVKNVIYRNVNNCQTVKCPHKLKKILIKLEEIYSVKDKYKHKI